MLNQTPKTTTRNEKTNCKTPAQNFFSQLVRVEDLVKKSRNEHPAVWNRMQEVCEYHKTDLEPIRNYLKQEEVAFTLASFGLRIHNISRVYGAEQHHERTIWITAEIGLAGEDMQMGGTFVKLARITSYASGDGSRPRTNRGYKVIDANEMRRMEELRKFKEMHAAIRREKEQVRSKKNTEIPAAAGGDAQKTETK